MRISSITGIVVGFLITAMGFGVPFIDPVRRKFEENGITGNTLYVVAFLFVAYGIFRLARSYNDLKRL